MINSTILARTTAADIKLTLFDTQAVLVVIVSLKFYPLDKLLPTIF